MVTHAHRVAGMPTYLVSLQVFSGLLSKGNHVSPARGPLLSLHRWTLGSPPAQCRELLRRSEGSRGPEAGDPGAS